MVQPLINVASPLAADANEGREIPNAERMGNRRYGQKMFLSGTQVPIATETLPVSWNAFETLTVSTTALPLTEAMSEVAQVAFITIESQAVRYRIDGQDPTASVGHVIEAGGTLELEGPWELDKFRVIRRDASDATARVTYGVRRDQ